jgi:hypothetical protein
MEQPQQPDQLAVKRLERAAEVRADAAAENDRVHHALDRKGDPLEQLEDKLDHRDFLARLEARRLKR